jgi:hypothetical protein
MSASPRRSARSLASDVDSVGSSPRKSARPSTDLDRLVLTRKSKKQVQEDERLAREAAAQAAAEQERRAREAAEAAPQQRSAKQ